MLPLEDFFPKIREIGTQHNWQAIFEFLISELVDIQLINKQKKFREH
jgi:hypothetical protein